MGAKGKGLMEEKERYLEEKYVDRSASGHARIRIGRDRGIYSRI